MFTGSAPVLSCNALCVLSSYAVVEQHVAECLCLMPLYSSVIDVVCTASMVHCMVCLAFVHHLWCVIRKYTFYTGTLSSAVVYMQCSRCNVLHCTQGMT